MSSCLWDATGSYACDSEGRKQLGTGARETFDAVATAATLSQPADCKSYGCPVGQPCSWSSDCANGLSCDDAAHRCVRSDPWAGSSGGSGGSSSSTGGGAGGSGSTDQSAPLLYRHHNNTDSGDHNSDNHSHGCVCQ